MTAQGRDMSLACKMACYNADYQKVELTLIYEFQLLCCIVTLIELGWPESPYPHFARYNFN